MLTDEDPLTLEIGMQFLTKKTLNRIYNILLEEESSLRDYIRLSGQPADSERATKSLPFVINSIHQIKHFTVKQDAS